MPQPHRRRHHRAAPAAIAALVVSSALLLATCSSSGDGTSTGTSAATSTTNGTAVTRVLDELVGQLGLDRDTSNCIRTNLAAAASGDESAGTPALARQVVDATERCHARPQLVTKLASDIRDPDGRSCAERVLGDASIDDLAAVIAGDTAPIQQCVAAGTTTTGP